MQASVLNNITETKTFDKVKKEPELKNTQVREANIATHQRQLCRYCGGGHTPRQCPVYGKICAACSKDRAIWEGVQEQKKPCNV